MFEETSSSILPAASSSNTVPSGGWFTTVKPLLARIMSRNEEVGWGDFGAEGDAGVGFKGDFDCDRSKNPLRMLALKVVLWLISGRSKSESPVKSIISGTLGT